MLQRRSPDPFSTGSQARARGGRGVTLLELMIVLVVLGALSLLSVPRMRGFYERNQLAAAAREFASLARYARQTAVLQSQNTELRVDFEKDRYRLVLEPEMKKSYSISRSVERTEMERTHYLDAKEGRLFFRAVASATDPFGKDKVVKIKFFKNGSASATTLVITDPDKHAMTIEILGATGVVRAYPGLPREVKAAFGMGRL